MKLYAKLVLAFALTLVLGHTTFAQQGINGNRIYPATLPPTACATTGATTASFWAFFGSSFGVTNLDASSTISWSFSASPNIISANLVTPVTVADGGTGTSTTPTAGQLLIGTSGGGYVPAGLTAGSNITITPVSGGITIAASGGTPTLPTDYISGFNLIYDTTAIIKAGSGSAYVPAASAVITNTSPVTNTPTLAASTLYYVYLNSSGALTVNTTAPSSNYQGTAWKNSINNRYIGSFATNSASQIIFFATDGKNYSYNNSSVASSATNVLNVGNASSATAVSCANLVPPTAEQADLYFNGNGAFIGNNINATTTNSNYIVYVSSSPGQGMTASFELNAQEFYYLVGATFTLSASVIGYTDNR